LTSGGRGSKNRRVKAIILVSMRARYPNEKLTVAAYFLDSKFKRCILQICSSVV